MAEFDRAACDLAVLAALKADGVLDESEFNENVTLGDLELDINDGFDNTSFNLRLRGAHVPGIEQGTTYGELSTESTVVDVQAAVAAIVFAEQLGFKRKRGFE
ncbi:MAG TPA: hypothetical protein VIT68_03320 [Candidatus Gracilibacteria bacterium]